jgi:hypothetical protein
VSVGIGVFYRAVPSVYHSASLITRMTDLLSYVVQMVIVTLHELTVVLCVVLSSSCVLLLLCACAGRKGTLTAITGML